MNKKFPLLVLAAVVTVTAAWYGLAYRSEASRIASLRAKDQTAQLVVSGLQAHYASLIASKRSLPREKRALKALEVAVPQGPELDQIDRSVYHAAGLAHVQVTGLGSPAPTGFGQAGGASGVTGTPAVSLSVSVTGTTGAITRFVKCLDSEKRLYVVDNFQLSLGKGSTSTEFNVRAFYTSPAVASAASR